MITAIDTNVLALIHDHAPSAPELGRALHRLAADGPLVICGVVYAELLAGPQRPRAELDAFLGAVGVALDPDMGEVVWAEAGRANADYHARRRAGGLPQPRPVLPDFLVGAHALHRADRLYTENVGDFSDFPALTVIEALR
ncbi:type II toxin-antitoxin system VapC family toxin [Deinococcus radiopugnans]|uniref:type II toxin-antitoxin system VapC family toxin n=1 Tax=Deinococcus radiopugnans TaxID=57497 RepID=UPI00068D2E0B|nr:type II toxin-antitoxin system VapC family toxin [Deinococcus radiopugnans]